MEFNVGSDVLTNVDSAMFVEANIVEEEPELSKLQSFPTYFDSLRLTL